MLIAENPVGEMVGWMCFKDFYGRPAYSGTAEISIYLDENFRGFGLGKKMLKHGETIFPQFQIRVLLAFIFKQNKPSITIFANAGFEVWGNLPDVAVLDGQPCSLLILGKNISA